MMNSLIRIDLATELDEVTAEAQNAGGTPIARFRPASGQAPAGTAALRVPAAPLENIWAELEALHKKTIGRASLSEVSKPHP